MRWIAFLCFLFFSTAAWALDDCNAKFPKLGQLEDRLKCLQSNNNTLQNQIEALNAGSSSVHAVPQPVAKPKPIAKAVAKPVTPPRPVAKPKRIAKEVSKPVTPPQPLTRAACNQAGMQWNSNANVCGDK